VSIEGPMQRAPDASDPQAAELLAILESSLAPRALLLALVRLIDLAVVAAQGERSFADIALARAVSAAGRASQTAAPIDGVLEAAEAFALDPTEATHTAYQAAATSAYPFGPGDGCLAVPELGEEGCGPGSGCVSGAGTLIQIAEVDGDERVAQAIVTELVAWLHGTADPVAERHRRREA
jgi:hypothetical protein